MAVHKSSGRGSSKHAEPISDELPTDLSALATILEAAMLGDDAVTVPRPSFVPDVVAPPLSEAATPVDPQPARRAGDGPPRETIAYEEVARSLAAAEACVPLLAQSTGLLRIAALDVVRAETARAGGLLQLIRFLRGDIAPPTTLVSVNAVVQRVAQAIESEKRLRAINLMIRSSAADVMVAGDETLLANTLLMLLLITFAAVEGVPLARVVLSTTIGDDGHIAMAITQDHVAAPPAWPTREADDGSASPGQAVAAITLTAARRLARQWRGRFTVASGDHSSLLTMWLPLPPAGEPLHES